MAEHGGGYQSFVAGLFSGVTRLAVGHPFDTVKVRMQTNPNLRSPLDCLKRTVKNEGFRGLYKGATPPLVGFMLLDSVMFGSLTNYRHILKNTFWPDHDELPFKGKIAAAIGSGWTVSLVAAPIENVKARLQVQYNAGTRKYTGPIDCAKKLIQENGVRGLYRGLPAVMLVGTHFAFWWGSYDLLSKWFKANTNMSTLSINFWAGGLGAAVFWTTAFPSDVVKQQILTDDIKNPRFKHWIDACRYVYANGGLKAFGRGFTPSLIRAFPANAAALATFEAVMRVLK